MRLRCDCGNVYEVFIGKLFAESGTVSCGCYRRECFALQGERNRDQPRPALRTHGLKRHPLYHTWLNMMRRCHHPDDRNYKNYGGRGITVCPRWHDVAAYIEDIERLLGPRPDGKTMDRIDNDRGYEPGNVRWATAAEQSANKRPRIAANDG